LKMPATISPGQTRYPSALAAADVLGRALQTARANRMTRAIALVSPDREQSLAVLREIATASGVALRHYTMASRREFHTDRQEWTAVSGPTVDPVDLIQAGQDQRMPSLVAFEDMFRFLSDDGGDPRARAQLAVALASDNRSAGTVFAFLESPETERNLPSHLLSAFTRAEISYPTGAELVTLSREEMAVALARLETPTGGNVLDQWAAVLAAELPGLTQSVARNAIRDSLGDDVDLEAARARLARRKAEHLKDELAMALVEPRTEAPIGLDRLYRYVQVQRHRMCVPGRQRVKGILLVGPPGTGKTQVAAHLGRLLGVDTVDFQIHSLLSKWVGDSEARTERAFRALDALAGGTGGERGVVVFIDEFDKIWPSGDAFEGDGGVMMRVTARTLNWMSESEAPNLVVGTANDISRLGKMGDIITRKGRMDAMFFVDVPGRRARAAILSRTIGSRKGAADVDVNAVAEATHRFSGADLEGLVSDAAAEATFAGKVLGTAHLLQQADADRPRVAAVYERFASLREWGRLFCQPAGHDDRED
jgi:hypothetical protein